MADQEPKIEDFILNPLGRPRKMFMQRFEEAYLKMMQSTDLLVAIPILSDDIMPMLLGILVGQGGAGRPTMPHGHFVIGVHTQNELFRAYWVAQPPRLVLGSGAKLKTVGFSKEESMVSTIYGLPVRVETWIDQVAR